MAVWLVCWPHMHRIHDDEGSNQSLITWDFSVTTKWHQTNHILSWRPLSIQTLEVMQVKSRMSTCGQHEPIIMVPLQTTASTIMDSGWPSGPHRKANWCYILKRIHILVNHKKILKMTNYGNIYMLVFFYGKLTIIAESIITMAYPGFRMFPNFQAVIS